MKPFCEVIAFDVLPAVRALVARELIEKYNLSQKKAASLIGVSQPAISQYKNDIRGMHTNIIKENSKLLSMVEEMARAMAAGEIDNLRSTISFCKICKEMRFSGSGCRVHQARYPQLGTCTNCQDNSEFFGLETIRKKTDIKKLNSFK